MDLKPFCNRCLKSTIDDLSVTSCRHVVCRDCYQKCNKMCGYCKTACKVIKIDSQLPEEMKTYFKPFLPVLKKYEKIVKFQMEQLSIFTGKKRNVLKMNENMKDELTEKKRKVDELKKNYELEMRKNNELKNLIRKLRRTEPSNPFEMNSSRRHINNLSLDSDGMGPPRRFPFKSFNSTVSSTSDLASFAHNVTPKVTMDRSNRENSSFFINASAKSNISRMTTNSTTSSFTRTEQVRQMMKKANIRPSF